MVYRSDILQHNTPQATRLRSSIPFITPSTGRKNQEKRKETQNNSPKTAASDTAQNTCKSSCWWCIWKPTKWDSINLLAVTENTNLKASIQQNNKISESIGMIPIFMNSESSMIFSAHSLALNLTDKIDLWSNLSIYYA